MFRLLTEIPFGKMVAECTASTVSGSEFINSFVGYTMSNPVSMVLIDKFLRESRNYQFDQSVLNLSSALCKLIEENKYTYALSLVCERLQSSNSKQDFLAKNATKQVVSLLEMKEEDVVKYIKAGAMKNVQFVREFRDICSAVYKDTTTNIETISYSIKQPVSFVELVEGKMYFQVLGQVYSMNENNISLEKSGSSKFNYINEALKNFKNENNKFSISVNNTNYVIETQGELSKDGEVISIVEFKEYAGTYLKGVMPTKRNSFTQLFESLILISENFNSIVELDNVHVISTPNNIMSIVEGNNYVVSNHASKSGQLFSTTMETIVEACSLVREKSGIDLNSIFENKITQEIEEKKSEETKEIQESLNRSLLIERRNQLESLANKFKNDPVKLAVVNKLALDLADLMETEMDENISEESLDLADLMETGKELEYQKQFNSDWAKLSKRKKPMTDDERDGLRKRLVILNGLRAEAGLEPLVLRSLMEELEDACCQPEEGMIIMVGDSKLEIVSVDGEVITLSDNSTISLEEFCELCADGKCPCK